MDAKELIERIYAIEAKELIEGIGTIEKNRNV